MKANQSFKQNDEAVSPVIGVILMVAITVVLAAVVFVLVGNLTETGEDAPTIAFIKDEQADTLTVSSLDWGGSTLYWYNGTGTTPTANSVVINGCTLVEGAAIPTADTAAVNAGDVIAGCSGTVTITHASTETLMATFTFS